MSNRLKQKNNGFTLLEMVLVLAIMTVILIGILGYTTQKSDELRRDRTAMQMQQILNSALAYYINSSTWPSNVDALKTSGYLPNVTIKNPWQQDFYVGSDTTSGQFFLCTSITGTNPPASVTAGILTGRLPMAYTTTSAASTCPPTSITQCSSTDASCTLVSSVSIPGQNLNNARSVNFAGVYHHGGCVPVPTCPGSMTPEIMAAPVSVSGMNDPSSGGSTSVYPISSFTAYAKGGKGSGYTILKCTSSSETAACQTTSNSVPCTSSTMCPGDYWRVCLNVVTEKGTVDSTNPDWGQSANILAVTRCAPPNEPVGSSFSVYRSD